MRLFVGIDLSEHIREHLQSYIEGLQRLVSPDTVKWTRPQNWHLTLKFLGETQKLEQVKTALLKINMPTFEFEVSGTGFFTPRSPRIFWAGVKGSAALPALATEIDEHLLPVGFVPEDKVYSPHITLARFGSGRPKGSARDRNQPKMYHLKALLDARPQLSEARFGTMTATEFILFESRPSASGSDYFRLEKYRLKID